MNKLVAAVGSACVLFLTPIAASAMTETECAAAWKAADTNSDGFLDETEGGRYFASMRVSQKTMAGPTMTQAAFAENCKAGVFNAAVVDAGAPLPGANSFTEGQAKDRAMAAGFMNVTGLAKDDKGVWRGKASTGGKNVSVAVDFKGNVVAN